MNQTRNLISGIILAVSATAAPAAEFTIGGAAETGCLFTMSGEIIEGDAGRFTEFVRALDTQTDVPVIGEAEQGQRRHLCLNSPGGNLFEAIEIIESLLRDDAAIAQAGDPFWLRNLGTAVPPGASCASACAILFFAGQQSEGDFGRHPDRLLHASGQLGFHSPDITFRKGTYSDAEMEEAFDTALYVVARFFELSPSMEMPLGLVAQNFLTPSEDIALLDRAAQAANYRVEISGLPPPAQITRAHVETACELAARPEPALSQSNKAEARLDKHNPVQLLWQDRPLFTRFEWQGDMLHFTITADDEGDYGCEGEISADGYGWLHRDNGAEFSVRPWMLYPGNLPLAQIHHHVAGRDRAPEDTVLDVLEYRFDTTCYALRGGAVAGKADCSIKSRRMLYATGDTVLRQKLTWENGGAEIVVENGAILIDGAVVEVEKDPPSGLDGANDICLDHGNGTFCYRLN